MVPYRDTAGAEKTESLRRYSRHHVRVNVTLFMVFADERLVIKGVTADLCEKGMALYLPQELKLRQRVQLHFRLPASRRELDVNAVVRDCDGFRCGVEFVGLTPAEEACLAQCCMELSRHLGWR